MTLRNIIDLFERDLQKLITEIESYPSEESLWAKAEGISNSGGTLALHLIGNLNHFIGAVIGKTDYVRNREAEFSDRDISRATLIPDIKSTIAMIREVLGKPDAYVLSEIYPVEVFGSPMSTEYFLIHLYGHLNYHLGQVNYHRRLLS